MFHWISIKGNTWQPSKSGVGSCWLLKLYNVGSSITESCFDFVSFHALKDTGLLCMSLTKGK